MNQQQTLMAGRPGAYPARQACGESSRRVLTQAQRDGAQQAYARERPDEEESCIRSRMTGNIEKILATTRCYWAIPASSRPRRY